MTSAAKALPAVLERIDTDLDRSLNRLFDLVRIPSISTDSASYGSQTTPSMSRSTTRGRENASS